MNKNQRSRIGIALFSIGLAIVTCASIAGAADIKRLKAADNGSFKVSDGSTLLYALSEPEKLKQGERYPLVVFLHGAGGMSGKRKTDRGKDGGDQLFQTMTEECYFFMPQASAIMASRHVPVGTT
jgi:predicted peptidase